MRVCLCTTYENREHWSTEAKNSFTNIEQSIYKI